MSLTAVPLLSRRDQAEAKALIEAQDLSFEASFDELIGIHEAGRLIAAGARSGFVLKMLAITPEHQGTEVLGTLISGLMQLGRAAGQTVFFIYTRPENAVSFEQFNFRLLLAHGPVALLEYGRGLESYLESQRPWMQPGNNGAVIVNTNPLTYGHLHLIESAAAKVDRLHVFVVREDRSVFPFDVRFRLVREATRPFPNVHTLETSRYAISAGTFPSYFLKKVDEAALAQMQIDLRLFAAMLAPPFSVRTRFVGQEPFCRLTEAYNRTMAEVLPEYGISVVEIPRFASGGEIVSATRVREAMSRKDWSALASMVPPITLEYLLSPEGRALADQLARMREQRGSEA